MWTPLNCLLEAATGTGTKPSNFDYQDFSNPKPQPSDFSNKEYLKSAKPEKVDERESYLFGTKGKENGHGVMMEEDEHARILLPGEARSRRIQAMKRKQSAAAGKLVAPQGFLTTMRDKQVRRNRQVWFSLVASKDQDSCTPLPQISANYLRLKDGNIPVASIQKYLAKKLDLPNESEVQVMCHGQRMHPTAPLHDLVDLWVRETSGTKMVPATTVGASGLDFVMILSYARSAQAG